MRPTPLHIQRLYIMLMLINTLAASLIWGINTIFLLDAGLSNAQAFMANAFFTIGQVFFEIPTGVIADMYGRRYSYLLGTLTLGVSTLFYLGAWTTHSSMVVWALSSILLGLGFTFFSGATEAWLVDALEFAGYTGKLDDVFAKGQMVSGIAMLVGSVSGGFIAQQTNLGVPYMVRAGLLGLNFLIAFLWMKDWGFELTKKVNISQQVQSLFSTSIEVGLKNPNLRYMIFAAPFTAGVGFYTFYAMQPHLLALYQDEKAYGVAGLAAAIIACAQIVGGMLVPHIQRVFSRRTTLLSLSVGINVLLLVGLGTITNFFGAIVLLCIWGLVFSATTPVRQAYMNGLIASKQRATVLSFDNSFTSLGGVVIQPILGRVADQASYGLSFCVGAGIQAIALPFILLARRKRATSDTLQPQA